MTYTTHVVIIAVVARVAWNENKFCVYEVSIPHFMLSNIADTVNKHTMAMADENMRKASDWSIYDQNVINSY